MPLDELLDRGDRTSHNRAAVGDQVRADAARWMTDVRAWSERWSRDGDNLLILATVGVLILLMLAIGLA
jgi:hypothetical protein